MSGTTLTRELALKLVKIVDELEVIDKPEYQVGINVLSRNHPDIPVEESGYFEIEEGFKDITLYDAVVQKDGYYYEFNAYETDEDIFGEKTKIDSEKANEVASTVLINLDEEESNE